LPVADCRFSKQALHCQFTISLLLKSVLVRVDQRLKSCLRLAPKQKPDAMADITSGVVAIKNYKSA